MRCEGKGCCRADVGIIVWDWTRRSDWQGVIPWLVWDVKEGRKESQAGVDGMARRKCLGLSGVRDLRGENVEVDVSGRSGWWWRGSGGEFCLTKELLMVIIALISGQDMEWAQCSQRW